LGATGGLFLLPTGKLTLIGLLILGILVLCAVAALRGSTTGTLAGRRLGFVLLCAIFLLAGLGGSYLWKDVRVARAQEWIGEECTVDAVVLGCTHFPFAKDAISHTVGGDIPIFDGVEGTARQVGRRLQEAGLLNPAPARGAVCLTSSLSRLLPHYARLLFCDES
jgi:hypothetical protein